jgi:hypothetical protein
MANGTVEEEFKQQTPGAYKWAVGAGGLVVAATTAALAFKPETAGYSLSGLVLFILLIFVVISLEMGTTKLEGSSPLARNARIQVTERHMKIRIPTQGGMLEWSFNDKFNECDTQYCWGDVAEAMMIRSSSLSGIWTPKGTPKKEIEMAAHSPVGEH